MPSVDIRIGASYITSKIEREMFRENWEAAAEERLMRELTFLLQKERSTIIEKDDFVEKRIDLYVASPEIFWKIVREEAEKIARMYLHERQTISHRKGIML